MNDDKKINFSIPKYKRILLWAVLAAATLLFTVILHMLRLPAAPLIGGIFAGIAIALCSGSAVKVPRILFQGAQSILGCMIAHIFTLSVLYSISDHWALVLFCVFSMLIFSFILGYILSARGILPGSTAVWGSWPGAAATMVILSEAYGADIRLVAFMQYLRVVTVALIASLVAMYAGIGVFETDISFVQYIFPSFGIKGLLTTFCFAALCTAAARVLRIPSGPLLLAMVFGAVLINLGIIDMELPQWLLVISYVTIGWSIGLRFSGEIIRYALKALPWVFGAIIILILLCAGVAAIMVKAAGIDPLTAYLAASPGGADSVAIIAASSKVDMPFVMSVQIMRFVVILIAGPSAARFMAKRINAGKNKNIRYKNKNTEKKQ